MTAPTGSILHGNDLVLIDPGGTVDLSAISKADIKDVDAFVFTTDESVNFTLSGANTLSFKGVVTTNAGDDIITLNSKSGLQSLLVMVMIVLPLVLVMTPCRQALAMIV